MKIKDFYLSLLSEGKDDFYYLDKNSINNINDVNYSKEHNYIRIDFTTTFGKQMSVVSNYDDFLRWFSDKKQNSWLGPKNIHAFKEYVSQFVADSKEIDPFLPTMNEIVDDNGNIMPSTDLPNNSTQRMVGDKIKWDIDKVYKASTPKGIRYFSGNIGLGIVVW